MHRNKIKIKNFGTIKEGYQENDGWLEVKKVTIFIGNQGSGKSTVAKLISTFMWLEKSLAVKADTVKSKLTKKELIAKLSNIVPLSSTIKADDLAIYELDENNGIIRKLVNFEGIPF